MYRGAVDLAIDIPSQRGCRVCAMTHERQPGRGKRPWWNWSILSTDLQMTTERDVLIVRRVGMRDGAAALACAGPRLAERPRRWPGGFVRRAAASPPPPARQVRTLTHAPGSRASHQTLAPSRKPPPTTPSPRQAAHGFAHAGHHTHDVAHRRAWKTPAAACDHPRSAIAFAIRV